MTAHLLLTLALALGQTPSTSSKPFKPTIKVRSTLPTAKTWNADMAAHLLRRAGFGGTPEQIALLAGMSREQAVEYLIRFDEVREEPLPIDIDYQRLPRGARRAGEKDAEIQKQIVQRQRNDQAQMARIINWWIETMTITPRPLQEKLVLFWHGHFTSGFREVKSSRALFNQNQLFRTYAAGNFRELVLAVTRDPAMIVYLNSHQNRRGKPNENYARELMELFTLGTGHYSEQDIKEAARALTGISLDLETGDYMFRPRMHDDGIKTFMGKRGDFKDEDIIDIILAQPAAAEHLAIRLWTFFAYEEPEPKIVKPFAQAIRDAKFEMKPVLKAMFMCDAFYSDRARFTHVKSPVELVIGTLRMLEAPASDTDAMNFAMRAMGQQLFQPPNVKGWDGGASWITTSTLYNRYNSICRLIDGTDNDQSRRQRSMMRERIRETFGKEGERSDDDRLQPAYDPIPHLRAANLTTPEQIVDHYTQRLLQRPLASDRRAVLIETFVEEWKRARGDDDKAAAIRGLIKLIVSMPEYQLS
ncbi:MAG: DUF1800 domain-containing protein [Planctomycetes bacterium]|nr:DUF1800 domain-containing protein [Planctomycetota bacterium]